MCVCVCVYLHNMWVHFCCYLILLCVMGGWGGSKDCYCWLHPWMLYIIAWVTCFIIIVYSFNHCNVGVDKQGRMGQHIPECCMWEYESFVSQSLMSTNIIAALLMWTDRNRWWSYRPEQSHHSWNQGMLWRHQGSGKERNQVSNISWVHLFGIWYFSQCLRVYAWY